MNPIVYPVGTVEYLPSNTTITTNINVTVSLSGSDTIIPVVTPTDALVGVG